VCAFSLNGVGGETLPVALAAAVAVGIVAVVAAGIVVVVAAAVAGFAAHVRKLRIPLSPVNVDIEYHSGINVEYYIGVTVVLQ
jgi:hypothetical protein